MIVEASDGDFQSLIAGAAAAGDALLADCAIAPLAILEMLRDVAQSIRPGFAPSAWLIVEAGEVIGLCSLTRPPQDGDLHIGYGIAPAHSGKGATTRAIGALLEWARNDPRVVSISAETGVDNIGSQCVLERNGFIRSGSRYDEEDGDLMCWSIAF
jgi:RimJ/RimL family protein N-acetyltransferase